MMLAWACAEARVSSRIAATSKASKKASLGVRLSEAKAQSVFDRFCPLKASSVFSARSARTSRDLLLGWCPSLAQAHSTLATCRGEQSWPCRTTPRSSAWRASRDGA